MKNFEKFEKEYEKQIEDLQQAPKKRGPPVRLGFDSNSQETPLPSIGFETLENLRDASSAAYNCLLRYFDISSDYCALAVFLDPRHKLDFYSDPDQSDEMNLVDRSRVTKQVREVFNMGYKPDLPENEFVLSSGSDDDNPIFKRQGSASRSVDEIMKYLEFPIAHRKTDPLDWWKKEE